MSFEGYYQAICENGHYNTFDAYYADFEEVTCYHCGGEIKFKNLVDQTNGDDVGLIPYDGLASLIIASEKIEVCNLGCRHVTSPAIYRLPTEEEIVKWKKYWEPSDWELG